MLKHQLVIHILYTKERSGDRSPLRLAKSGLETNLVKETFISLKDLQLFLT